MLPAAWLVAGCAPPPHRPAPAPGAPPASRIALPASPSQRAGAARLADRLEVLRQQAGLVGLAAVALHEDERLFARGYGLADRARRVPMRIDTPFDVGTLAIPLSAVLAMQLVERRQLDLDRPIADEPGLALALASRCAAAPRPPNGGGVNCRDARTSVRDLFTFGPPAGQHALAGLSARVMARGTTVAFSTLFEQLVLLPASMPHSARWHAGRPLAADLTQDLAPAYPGGPAGEPVMPRAPAADEADGGLVSTAADLARFDIALMRGTLIAPAAREAMWRPVAAGEGARPLHGLGWSVGERGGRRIVWQVGRGAGGSALYLKAPDSGFTLLLLANGPGLDATQLDGRGSPRSPFADAFYDAFGFSDASGDGA